MNALFVGGEDQRRAVVKVYTDGSVREGIPHTILIRVVHPRRDEHAFLRQIYIVARVTEKEALRVRITASNPLILGGRGSGRRCSRSSSTA